MSTNITNSTFIDQTLDSDNDSTFFTLVSSIVDAIWEQSGSSEINNSTWSRFGSISTYCCSVYGLACLVMALILNRTLVMASTNSIHNQQMAINRQRQISGNRGLIDAYKSAATLKKLSIFSFRIGVVLVLLYQVYNVLMALKLNQFLGLAGTSNIKWFYNLIPARFFTYSPEQFADTRYMKTPSKQVMIGPTSDMYWPIFLTFCFSAFIETFIACIQGRKPFTESGITIFEHSLAFQEFSSNAAFFFSNSYNYRRPTESVLITSLFSILNHLNIHVGAILNNNRYRLIPSTTLGLGFLAYFITALVNKKIFQFPIILALTFTPQVLILFVILVSLSILVTAIVVNGFRFEGLNYASFFLHEDRNQDNIAENEVGDEQDLNSLANFNIKLSDDFYTALLNLGVLAITSAGKSSYIKELSLVTLDNETWIERSLWQQVKSSIISNQASDADTSSLLRSLKQKKTGYSNLIEKPTSKLVTHGDLDSDAFQSSQENPYQTSSVFKRRFLYLRRIIVDFAQLLYRIVFGALVLQWIPNLFKKFWRRVTGSNRREGVRGAPLKKYENGSLGLETSSGKNLLELDYYSAEQLDQNYALILTGADLSNSDNSEDYVFAPEESDYESDVEVIDLTTNFKKRGFNDVGNDSSPLQEIFDNDGLKELFEQSSENNLQLIRDHLNYDGRLTRSRYRKLHSSTNTEPSFNSKDESEKLIELIISKRSQNSDDHTNENHRSMECVICQTNMREIITWPCKCFAICESCRLSLVSKGFEGCVCCRRDVEGVSKIYLP